MWLITLLLLITFASVFVTPISNENLETAWLQFKVRYFNTHMNLTGYKMCFSENSPKKLYWRK